MVSTVLLEEDGKDTEPKLDLDRIATKSCNCEYKKSKLFMNYIEIGRFPALI